MASSKSNRQQQRKVTELPWDVMANILSRVGVDDILENAQKVCTDWRKICKDPSMWRVICIDYPDLNLAYKDPRMMMYRHAVDRSQGQLIDITIGDFGHDWLLHYVADRPNQLRRLKIIIYCISWRSWVGELYKFPLLEEFGLYSKGISKEDVKLICRHWPLLKTLKLNEGESIYYGDYVESCNVIAKTIGENLHELEHLELIGNNMSNIGLQLILDGCPRLKSLDLRTCWFIDLKGDLWKRCIQRIKCLKLPHDSLQGCRYLCGYDDHLPDDYHYDGDHHDDLDYDALYEDGYLSKYDDLP